MTSRLSDSSAASTVKPLAGGATLLLLGRSGARAFSYVLQIVLGRFLGPAAFGHFAVGWNLLMIIGLVASLGLEHGVIRYGVDLENRDNSRLRRISRRALKLAGLAGAFAALGLWLLAPWLAITVFSKPDLVPVLRGLAVALIFVPSLRVAAATLRAALRMAANVVSEDLIQPLVHLTLFLLFWIWGWHLWGAVVAADISFAVALLAALLFLSRGVSGTKENRADTPIVSNRELLVFSVPASLAGVLTLVTMWIDRLLVAFFLTAADTGIYQAASQVASVFLLILNSFNGVFAPLIAGHFAAGRKVELAELYRVSTKWGLYLAAPLFLVVVVAPETVLTVLLDTRYSAGAVPLVVLSAAQLINLATGAVGFIFIMGGRQNSWLVLSSIALALNIGCSLVWIPRYGLNGAAWAALVSIVGLFGTALFLVRRWESLWPWDRRYAKGLLAALVTLGALLAVERLPIDSPMLQLLALAAAAVASFFVTLLSLGPDREDRELFPLIRSR